MAELRIGRVWSPGRAVYQAQGGNGGRLLLSKAEVVVAAEGVLVVRYEDGSEGRWQEKGSYATPEEAYRALASQLREQAAALKQRATETAELARKADEAAAGVTP